MISRVRLRSFKQFEDETFELADHVVLAGPNNSGKSALLQAIAVWHLALQRWLAARKPSAKGRKGAAVPITRKDFTAIPLREMKLLWTDTSTALKKGEGGKPGFPRIAEILLEGKRDGAGWRVPVQLRYQGQEQIYVKPGDAGVEDLETARDVNVVHVPPFSGIGVEETRYDRPYQDHLIGQGKPGDLLRNLLHEVYERSRDDWSELCRAIEEIFQLELLPPRYEGLPFILCEYLPSKPAGRSGHSQPRLDVSCGGSGFLQVLLLLAFFYARPATVLLLDEPDAHQHIVLQKQIYDLLRRVAVERRCQLVLATHSEVLIDNTSAEDVISFYRKPHRLASEVERQRLTEALKRLPTTDVLLAESSRGILYVEGETDFNLLKAWAKVLEHRLHEWFTRRPFWHANQGRHPREARGHFFALRAIDPQVKGVLLLDGDNRALPDHEVAADGLVVLRWNRYEVESYLVNPPVLLRFVERAWMPLARRPAESYLRDQLPPAVYRDPLRDHDFLRRTPVSKTLLPAFFQAAGASFAKQEYYLIAEKMERDEIPPEVVEKLDRIAEALGLA
ncbi:MAG: hypothetical protein D6696_20980 [Acidobacteria bacterium]|nr:MAG: hypothetical protein D6696_20980 [Acidobacteriota bacterium]